MVVVGGGDDGDDEGGKIQGRGEGSGNGFVVGKGEKFPETRNNHEKPETRRQSRLQDARPLAQDAVHPDAGKDGQGDFRTGESRVGELLQCLVRDGCEVGGVRATDEAAAGSLDEVDGRGWGHGREGFGRRLGENAY